jgi:hypothetical protein
VTVAGRHRLPTDVVSELMDVLAGEPAIAVCDLTEMAPYPSTMSQMFDPVAAYLANWPGTLVVVSVPDPQEYTRALPAGIAGRLLVYGSPEEGLAEASRLLRPVDRVETPLAPTPTAARAARQFTVRTLLDWQLSQLISPVSLVVSELVTNSVVHAVTVTDLTLSRTGGTVRIAVHDHAGGRPVRQPDGSTGQLLEKRGLVLVQAFTRCWGVFPSRVAGKTVWALVDAADVGSLSSQRARALS